MEQNNEKYSTPRAADYQSNFSRNRLVSRTPSRQLIQDPVSEGHGGLDVLLWAANIWINS